MRSTSRRERTRARSRLALSWPDPGGAVMAAHVPGTQAGAGRLPDGEQRSHDTADGTVLAAGLPADGPGDDPLHRVRQDGASVTTNGDVVEISCPVCADGVRPVAAILVGVPAYRAGEDQVAALTAAMREMAARISYRMGAAVYQPYGWAAGDPVEPSRDLTDAELKEFLSGLWGAQLACVRQDGTPHVVPLWYEWDGDAFWLAASPGASWQAYVAERARVSLTLDEPWPPLRRAFVDGVAEEVDEANVPGGLAGLRRRLAVRYLGKGADKQPGLSETDGMDRRSGCHRNACTGAKGSARDRRPDRAPRGRRRFRHPGGAPRRRPRHRTRFVRGRGRRERMRQVDLAEDDRRSRRSDDGLGRCRRRHPRWLPAAQAGGLDGPGGCAAPLAHRPRERGDRPDRSTRDRIDPVPTRAGCSPWSGSATSPTPTRRRFPEGCSSGCASPAPSPSVPASG